MKEINLTKNKVAFVDDEDFEWLNKFNWCAYKNSRGYEYYAVRVVNKEAIQMHRLIMNTPNTLIVHHIDHNGLNNQKNNLRNCTQSQNHYATKLYTKTYRGVNLTPGGKWTARIAIQGKKLYLGTFDTAEEAAIAYNINALILLGEFAPINLI